MLIRECQFTERVAGVTCIFLAAIESDLLGYFEVLPKKWTMDVNNQGYMGSSAFLWNSNS